MHLSRGWKHERSRIYTLIYFMLYFCFRIGFGVFFYNQTQKRRHTLIDLINVLIVYGQNVSLQCIEEVQKKVRSVNHSCMCWLGRGNVEWEKVDLQENKYLKAKQGAGEPYGIIFHYIQKCHLVPELCVFLDINKDISTINVWNWCIEVCQKAGNEEFDPGRLLGEDSVPPT